MERALRDTGIGLRATPSTLKAGHRSECTPVIYAILRNATTHDPPIAVRRNHATTSKRLKSSAGRGRTRPGDGGYRLGGPRRLRPPPRPRADSARQVPPPGGDLPGEPQLRQPVRELGTGRRPAS